MATTFVNKVVKEVGRELIPAIETNAGTRSTVIGMSFSNLKDTVVYVSVLVADDTSVTGYFLKDVMLPPNTSLRAVNGGEKLILAPNNTLYLQADEDEACDAVISYVDIV